jgi:hypothetical protein
LFFKNGRANTISQMIEFPGKLGLMSRMASRDADTTRADYELATLKVRTEISKF